MGKTVTHGRGPGFSLLVNAEVDPMGGIFDCGIGVDTKTSPRRAAIEKAQAELRYAKNRSATHHRYLLQISDVFVIYE